MPLKAEQVTKLLRDVWPPVPGWLGFAAGTSVKITALGVANVEQGRGLPPVAADVAVVEPLSADGKPTGILLRIQANELDGYAATAKPNRQERRAAGKTKKR